MFVSSAQAPYAGVYERQPTGIPRAEFIPQNPVFPSNGYQPATLQYPPQAAYQNNNLGGQIYVPQMNGQQVDIFIFR